MANPGQQMMYQQVNQQQRMPYAPGQPPPQAVPNQGAPPPPPASMQGPPMASPTKDVNTASACKVGQETIQEIVQKATELFQCLKITQLPNSSMNIQQIQDRKTKVEDCLKQINQLFRKLRVLYDKVQETCTQYDNEPVESLIPWEDEEPKEERSRNLEMLKYVSEEHKEMVEQLHMKNQQVKAVMDHLRKIIWEVNAMMATRKT